ncbi:MAG: hypothetical protein Q7O12_05670 [Deltaproteobacteria bacterium]|nr:hypothetical protein [Deltaproteobacteria bacterium]
MANWQLGQGTINTLYPSNVKKESGLEDGWDRNDDPRLKEAYESLLPPEQKARLIEIRTKEYEERKARYARGEGKISDIMYPSMSPLTKTEIIEQVEQAEQAQEREKVLAQHYQGDLLYQSMHHKLKVDAGGKLVSVKEDVKA